MSFYKFNGFAGRIVAASNIQTPLFPIRPVPLNKITPPVIYDKSVKLSTVADPVKEAQKGRRKIPGTDEFYEPISPELLKKREIFQADNDLPVHLKGGPLDSLLYRTTFALIGLGIVIMLYDFIRFANPKKQ